MRRIWKFALVAVMGLAVMACSNCGTGKPYKTIANAQRGVDHVARFGEVMDKALEQWHIAEREKCKKLHKPKTAEMAECLLPSLKIMWPWTGEKLGKKTGKGALQILQAGQRVARNVVNAAHDYVKSNEEACAKKEGAPAKCKPDWKAGLKPSLCAAWEIAKASVTAGAYKKTKDPAFVFVKTYADAYCGGAS